MHVRIWILLFRDGLALERAFTRSAFRGMSSASASQSRPADLQAHIDARDSVETLAPRVSVSGSAASAVSSDQFLHQGRG